jgi:hypothetical protein
MTVYVVGVGIIDRHARFSSIRLARRGERATEARSGEQDRFGRTDGRQRDRGSEIAAWPFPPRNHTKAVCLSGAFRAAAGPLADEFNKKSFPL